MRILKLLLVISVLLCVGLFNATAQVADSDGDGLADTVDKCPTIVGSRINDGCPSANPRAARANFGTVGRAEFKDCNNNGIDDLDEFLPPDCLQLTSNTGTRPINEPEFDPNKQEDIDLAWLLCPDGWVINEDGTLECHDFVIEDDD